MRRVIASLLPLLLCLSVAAPASADRSAPRSRDDKPRAGAAPSPAPASAVPATSDGIDIPYRQFQLSNGLTLVVHEDHDAPIAAVNVWYHVGSKNEKPGRTGFAHLFEHLMFQGSEHNKGEWFAPFDKVGATEQNGTTNNDRTNYFENVPVSALEMTLWLESDRMGHLLGAIDQAKLDEQRGVVQNEKRQNENQPYGKAWSLLAESTYPAGHPYSWSVIGSMEDLDAAKLDDVKEWFRTSYGPNNAVIVVAGDVEPEKVHALVEKAFGDIPPGPPLQRPVEWIAKMSGTKRAVMQDRVPQARLYRVWNVPGWGTPEATYLDLASDVLASGKGSRLWKRLVYDEQIATDVSAYAAAREIGGQFGIQVTAKPGLPLDRIEQIVSEEVSRLIADGPTAEELSRVKAVQRASFVKSLEKIGGFGGKSSVLAESMVYGGSPDAWKASWSRLQRATPEDVQRTMRAWLSDGDFVLQVVPFPQLAAAKEGADRSAMPVAAAAPDPRFPGFQRATLPNGLSLLLVENHSLPMVVAQLVVDAGYAADQHAAPGTSSLTLDMLDEGAGSRDSLAIAEALDRAGAELTTGGNLDVSTVSLSALSESLDPALDIFADVVLHPSFPQKELDRLKAQRLAAIAREKSDPNGMTRRVMGKLIYGEGHAYGIPFSGTGTEDAVSHLTREDLVAFHRAWFRPNAATLIVAGDVTMDSLRGKLERLFGSWERGDIPVKNLASVAPHGGRTLYLIDKPGASQSVILAAQAGPPKAVADDLAIEAMNRVFGGAFTSRLNMNLREDKHWSYGVRSSMSGTRGPRPMYVAAPVQTDKTKESVAEVARELKEIVTTRPVAPDEAKKAQDQATLTLPGRWETMSAVSDSLADVVRFGLPHDYWTTYASRVRALTADDLEAAAKAHVDPDHLTWIVVGDRAKIEAGLRDLKMGDVVVIDADGKPVPGALPVAAQ